MKGLIEAAKGGFELYAEIRDDQSEQKKKKEKEKKKAERKKKRAEKKKKEKEDGSEKEKGKKGSSDDSDDSTESNDNYSSDSEETPSTKKSFEVAVTEVIQGKHGNGEERKRSLREDGFSEKEVIKIQQEVNRRLLKK